MMSSYSTSSSVTAPYSCPPPPTEEKSGDGGASSCADTNRNTLITNNPSSATAALPSSSSSATSSAPPRRTSSPFRLRSPGTQLGEGVPSIYKSSPPVYGGEAAGVNRRQSVPQDGQQMLPNNSSSSSSNFKLLKQPLLDNPLSNRPAKTMSVSSTPKHSAMTSRASEADAANSKGGSSTSGNGSSSHSTQPQVVAPLKVQASLNEREELRKKLESSDSCSSDFKSKNARKISQKYHLQGAATVAERMVVFDPDSANKLRMRSPSPSTLEGTFSGVGESQIPSFRYTDSKLNSSFLRNVPLTIATSGPDAEPSLDNDPISNQRSTARLLMHTSPVPYKRPSDSGTTAESNQPDLPNRSATTVDASVLSSSDSRVSHRTNSLSVYDNNKSESSESCFLVRGASDASTFLIPSTVPATLRSTQLRRKFFNQTPEEVGPHFESLLTPSSLSSASGSNASFAELPGSTAAAGGVDEDAIVPSIALVTANAPTLDLRPFASPNAPNTIGRKKNMGFQMKEFSESHQAVISQTAPSKPSSSSTTSLFAKPFGTLMRKKKATTTERDIRSQSVKEATLNRRKDASPTRISLNTNFTNDFIESLVMKSESGKLPSANDSYEHMKMLEYLIRHCELMTMKSMVPCRKSVANRIDMNVMLVSNSINEMNAIYGTVNHLGGASDAKPSKPPRNEALAMGLSYHQPNTVVNCETMLGRKKSSNSPVQAEDYIESGKPPPKPLRTALSAPSASLLHSLPSNSDFSNECDLRTLDPKVFTHKYPPSSSGNSSKSKFFRASNLYSTLPKFSRRTKYSNSSKNPSKLRGLDECMSVPPIIHDVSEKGGDAMVLVDPRLLQARRLNPGQQHPVIKVRPGLEKIASSHADNSESETDSMDTLDVDATDDYPDVGNLNKKSQSVDNVRDMMSSLESLECAHYKRSVYSESNTVVISSTVMPAAQNDRTEGHSSGLVTSSPVAAIEIDHSENADQSNARQDSSAKKVQKATTVGRSTSCREQKPGTPNEKRELVRLKKKMKHLHRSLDNVLEIANGQKFTPSHSCNLSEDNSRQPHASKKAMNLMKSARKIAARRSAGVSQLVSGHVTSEGGPENGRLSCIGSDSFNFDEQSLASSTLSSSLERISFPVDERVRDKIYSVFGVARSLEDLNCDSANETSSEGLEKIDHLDFIQVPTEMAGTPDDETDAVRGSGAGGSFSYQVTRAKTTITSTRSDLPDPYGDRHRSTVTGTEVSSTNEGGALGDSALSLNHERSKESTQLFIVALHVGLKHKKIAGGGDEYVPVVITSYPHKDVIDAKECPFFQHVPSFCFPDVSSGPDSIAPKRNDLDETYSFMFTDDKGGQVFAYCRRIWPDESSGANNGNVSPTTTASPEAAYGGSRLSKKSYSEYLPTVYCIISQQRCFDLFDSICCELKLVKKQCQIFTVLQSMYECPVPAPGESIQIKYPFYIEHAKLKPGQHSLSIRRERKDATYEHVNLQCLPLYLDAKSLVLVFASLLLERKVWLWSSKLSVLSSCGMALHALIYPLTWEHVFVPMTSLELGTEIAKCPSPFLIGTLVPSSAKARPDVTSSCEYEDVLIVDLDNRGAFVRCVGDERKLLPERHFNALKKLIFDRKSLQKSPIVDIATTTVTPEYISESFLHFFVQVLYQIDNYISFDPTNPTTPSVFNKEKYIQARSKEMRPFLTAFTSTILFSRFLERRRPLEASRFNTRLKDYHNYREVTARTKRTGPKIFFRLSRTNRKPSINYPILNTDQLSQSSQ